VLHQTISAIRPETWEAVNQALAASANSKSRIAAPQCGSAARSSGAPMHKPSKRVVTRLLLPGQCIAGSTGDIVAQSPANGQEARTSDLLQPRAKEEAPALSRANRCHPRNPGRAARAAEQLANIAGTTAAERWHARLSHYLPLIG
jgi:transposase, IS5 family